MPTAKASMKPTTAALRAFAASSVSPRVLARASATVGTSSGAKTMAPIIIAISLRTRPMAAITADRRTIIR